MTNELQGPVFVLIAACAWITRILNRLIFISIPAYRKGIK